MGQIFLWKYHDNEKNKDLSFKPTHKYRVSLTYEKFSNRGRKDLKDYKAEFEEQFSECLDYRHAISGNGLHTFTLPNFKRYKDPKIMNFIELTFNPKKELMRATEGPYELKPDTCEFGRIRMTKSKKELAIELIKDHVFGDPEFKTIEIVFFKATMT